MVFKEKRTFIFIFVAVLLTAAICIGLAFALRSNAEPEGNTESESTAYVRSTTGTNAAKSTSDTTSATEATNTHTNPTVATIHTEETTVPETQPTEVTIPEETAAPTKPAGTENTQNTTSKPTYNNPPLDPSVTFADYNIWVDGKGYVPLAEAYAAGKARVKVVNGVAYLIQTLNGVDYIQRADPDTGISYDGESPIIYTYADGTTGTEKQEGATYEELPGVYKTFAYSYDSVGRIIGSTCETCGLEVGGRCQAGYCLQWWFVRYCTCCGELVNGYTCHHCPEPEYVIIYCQRCGKKYGDGTNDTCTGWLVDHTCPLCDTLVPAHTCHTCEEPQA